MCGVASLVERIEEIEAGPEVAVAIGRAVEELERRVEDVEAGQLVSDDGLMMAALESRLARLEWQTSELLALVRARFG